MARLSRDAQVDEKEDQQEIPQAHQAGTRGPPGSGVEASDIPARKAPTSLLNPSRSPRVARNHGPGHGKEHHQLLGAGQVLQQRRQDHSA